MQTLIELGYRRTGLVEGAADERDLASDRGRDRGAPRRSSRCSSGCLEPGSVTALRGEIAQLQLAYAPRDRGAVRRRAGRGRRAPARRARSVDVAAAQDLDAARGDVSAASRDRRLRRLGLLRLPRRRRGGRGRHAVRPALRPALRRRDRRHAGSRSCPATAAPPPAAPRHPVPGEPVGDARARRAAPDRALCVGQSLTATCRPARSSSATSSSTALTAATTPSTTARSRPTSSAADPYCPDLRQILLETGREQGIDIRDGGTMVVIQGPRFSTRAESAWFSLDGVGGHQHDRVPRGLARPRARASATPTSR